MSFISSFLLVFAIVCAHAVPAHAQGRAERAIQRNDADGDGKISPNEFPRPARVFRRLDTDGDGYITLEEFKARFSESSERDRPRQDFRHMDANNDHQVSRKEWNRRGNFDRLDTDGNGYLSLKEVRAHYRRSAPIFRPDSPGAAPEAIGGTADRDALSAAVPAGAVSRTTACGMVRGRGCAPRSAVEIGMVPTGLGPSFPEGMHCHAIDDYWAMDYSYKRHRQVRHGGIDLPADWGTPVRAAADGTVVAVFEGKDSPRGKEVILRHAPHQTRLPFWTYTGYAHLDALPPSSRVNVSKRDRC